MSFTDLLAAICLFVNGAKGMSALQLSRDLECQYKTAFVLFHKLREALSREVHGQKLDDEVEIDGCYVGGHIRPANHVDNRVDRRLARYQTGKRRVVIAMRERKGRTLTFVSKREADGVEIAEQRLPDDTTVYADEASHWDALHDTFKTKRINHSEAYSMDGANTNLVESFFSRLRKMVGGQHHHVSPQHLHQYAAHAAWMEDHRRDDNGTLASRVLGLAMVHPVSRNWKGYWQRAVE